MQLTQQGNFNILFPVTSGVIFCHYQYGLDWDMKADALTLWMTIYYLKDTVVVSKEQREASQQVSCHVINCRPVTLMTKERQGAGTMRTFVLSSFGKGAHVPSALRLLLPPASLTFVPHDSECDPENATYLSSFPSWKAPWLWLTTVIRPNNTYQTPSSSIQCLWKWAWDNKRTALERQVFYNISFNLFL